MMILNTLAEQISSNKVRVLWRNGTQMKGVLAITVNFSAAEKDIPVIAELIAIRYLVVEKKVFGSVPKGGSSIRLCVGSREIPQLVKEQEIQIIVNLWLLKKRSGAAKRRLFWTSLAIMENVTSKLTRLQWVKSG